MRHVSSIKVEVIELGTCIQCFRRRELDSTRICADCNANVIAPKIEQEAQAFEAVPFYTERFKKGKKR
jgi:hypothetical protein